MRTNLICLLSVLALSLLASPVIGQQQQPEISPTETVKRAFAAQESKAKDSTALLKFYCKPVLDILFDPNLKEEDRPDIQVPLVIFPTFKGAAISEAIKGNTAEVTYTWKKTAQEEGGSWTLYLVKEDNRWVLCLTPEELQQIQKKYPPKSQGAESIYKITEAGIQFNVPPGWKVEKDKDRTVTVSKTQNDSYVVIAITALAPEAADLTPEAQFKSFSEGVFSNAKKDFKGLKKSEVVKDTQNGMATTTQSFESKLDNVDMAGLVILMSAARPVGIFAYGTAKVSDDFSNEIHKMLTSIKKLE